MPELQQEVNDGVTKAEEEIDGKMVNVLQRTGDPVKMDSEIELNRKKSELSNLGFSIKEMSKEDYKKGIGFVATKYIASDTVRRLSFIVPDQKE